MPFDRHLVRQELVVVHDVELQHTFYEPPSDALLQRWRQTVPPDFEFTIKAWQPITHEANSSRHAHTDSELRQLRQQVEGRPDPYVLFNNLPRVGDAERFLDLGGRHDDERSLVAGHFVGVIGIEPATSTVS